MSEVSHQGSKALVYQAISMIQRDAILGVLAEANIEAWGAERDVSRKYGDSSVDLAYEGYSATMGGFSIFAESSKVEVAKLCIRNFLAELPRESVSETRYLERFYGVALFSMMLPFVAPLGAYYLFKGLAGGESKRGVLFWPSVVMLVLGFVAGGLGLYFVNWSQVLAEGLSYFDLG